MKMKWTRPQLSIDNFELSQHIAAKCKDPQKVVIINANFDCGQQSCSHNWTFTNVNAFETTAMGCVEIWTSEADMVKWAKDNIDKIEGNAKDHNAWGNKQHDPIINGYSWEELFSS